MILVWGSISDPPIASVLDALDASGAPTFRVDDGALAALRYDIIFNATPAGWIESAGRRISVEEIRGAYLRPAEPSSAAARITSTTLLALANSLGGVVVNRPSAGRSNASKPYQLGLIAEAGFDVPDTLITTDPSAARAFLHEHGRLVYKSLSGIRSIVAPLERKDEARLDDVRSGPVQLQAYITGLDIRVHIVGNRWFACSVRSPAVDYRYAAAAGMTAELSPFDLPKQIGDRLVALARAMDLEVAGVDLRLTPDKAWYCFEVNPSPGFTWYEEQTGHPIAQAIADLLQG